MDIITQNLINVEMWDNEIIVEFPAWISIYEALPHSHNISEISLLQPQLDSLSWWLWTAQTNITNLQNQQWGYVKNTTDENINWVKTFNDWINIKRGNEWWNYTRNQLLLEFNWWWYRHAIKTRHHSTVAWENAIDLSLWTSWWQNDLPNYTVASFQKYQSSIYSNEFAIKWPDNQWYIWFYGNWNRRWYIWVGWVWETSLRYQNDDGTAHVFRDWIRIDNKATNFWQALLSLWWTGNIFVDAPWIWWGRLTWNDAWNRWFGWATNPQLKVSVWRDNTWFTNDNQDLLFYSNGAIWAKMRWVNNNADDFTLRRRLTIWWINNTYTQWVTSQMYTQHWSNISKMRSTTYVDRDWSIVWVNRIWHWMYPENDTWSITAFHQYDYIDRVPANSTTNAWYAATPRQQIVRRISSSFGYQDLAYCPQYSKNSDAANAWVPQWMFYRDNCNRIKVVSDNNQDQWERQSISLLNWWAQFAWYNTVWFRKEWWIVSIRWLIQWWTNPTFWVLPVWYRPAWTALLHTMSASWLTRVDIDANWNMTFQWWQSSGWTSIELLFSVA